MYYSTAHQLKRAAFLILVLLIPAQALSQSAVLDMTASPASQGWTIVNTGLSSSNWVPGLLTLTSPASTLIVHKAPETLWNASAADPTGFEIEANMKVTAFSESSSTVAGLYINNGIQYTLIDIFNDHIEFNGSWTGTTSHAMDTTDDFHQYIVSGIGFHVDVFVDGVLVLSGENLVGTTFAPFFHFGKGFYPDSSTTEWDYVAFKSLGAVATEGATWGEVKALFR